MGLRERKLINNLPKYKEGLLHMPIGDEGWGNAATGAVSLATNTANAFGPVKSSNTLMAEAGTSTGYGSGFTYQRQDPVNSAALMSELSQETTSNALKTAAAGASLGATFGPIGAGIGLVAGGALGLIGGAARKRKLINEMKDAKVKTGYVNDFNLASGQSNFLESDYNTKYNTTQHDLLLTAKNGKEPGCKLALGLEPNAMVSNGEIIGHVDNFGNVIDAMRVGHGKDNKDTVPVHLAGGKQPSDNSFVITNKGGISDYVAATGDVKGGLLMLKNMKEYQRYKLLWNGRIPETLITGYRCGKTPKYAEGSNPIYNITDQDVLNAAKSYQQLLGGNSFLKTTEDLMPKANDWDTYKRLIAGDTEQPMDYYIRKSDDYIDTTGSKRTSWLGPAALSALGIATAYGMKSKGNPYISNTYAENPYEQLIRSAMASRRPNILNQIAAVRDAEARGRYTARNMGTSIGAYLPMIAALNIGALKNIANILAAGDNLRNQYLNEQASMDAKLGGDIASRRMNSNQFRDTRYDRAASMKYTLDNNAYAQMLGQAQYGYKNIFDLNKWLDTMGLYNRDYALRRDELNRRAIA